MVYSIQTKGRKGSSIPSKNSAIVLHQGGAIQVGGENEGMVDSCTTVQVNEYLVEGALQLLINRYG